MRLIKLLLALLVWAGLSLSAAAQNTSGVLGPDVKEDSRSIGYRIAFDLDTGEFAQRLHYQQAINRDLRWRAVIRTRETDSNDFDFDYVQAELLWQISPDGNRYRTGLRFDARLRDNDRPGQLGLNWANQWKFGDGWTTRLVGVSALQIGENRRTGISFGPRAQVSKKLDGGTKIGVDYFGSFGDSDKFAFKKTRQGMGPYVSTKLVGKTDITVGLLFGLTEAAPDTDLRLFLTQGF